MSMTIGRVGVTTANGGDGAVLDGPESVARDGTTLTVRGAVYGSAHAASMWRARQIAGLADRDEPVVPVTFSDAPELDGYYRVLSAALDYQVVGTSTYEAVIPWQVQLEQIPDFRLPRIEFPVVYGRLSNGHGLTSVDIAWGTPGTVVDQYNDITTLSTTRSVGDGSTSAVWYVDNTPVAGPTSAVNRLVVAPANLYHASARVEWDIASSPYRSVTGRASWPQAGGVRLGNGLVRVEWAAATSSTLTVSWWDGASWSTASNFTLSAPASAGTFTATSARVLRNTPEQCVVRFTARPSVAAYGAVTFDVMVRRGVRWATIYGQSLVSLFWVLGFTSTTATSAITGGSGRTVNNGSGDRELMLNRLAVTANHTTGTLTVNAAATTTLWGIGCEVNGSAATGRDINGEQRDEWFGLYEDRGLVVAN